MITRKMHLMNKFKINILINNDIFDSKIFEMFMFNKTTYIKSCEIIISITIISHRFIKYSKFTQKRTTTSYLEYLIF